MANQYRVDPALFCLSPNSGKKKPEHRLDTVLVLKSESDNFVLVIIKQSRSIVRAMLRVLYSPRD